MDLIKFPRTRHIFDAGGSGVSRDDLVLDKKEANVWFTSPVSIEEKIDGSNLGISITQDYEIRFQNRSHYVTVESQAQWKGLDKFIKETPGIYDILTPDIVLYGEWMVLKHSLHYSRLPSPFIAFDIYDKNAQQFYSRVERDRLLQGTGIQIVPLIAEGIFTKDQFSAMLDTNSEYYDGYVEGIYVRIDEGQYLNQRAKVVRPDFIQTINEGEHWQKQVIKNKILY